MGISTHTRKNTFSVAFSRAIEQAWPIVLEYVNGLKTNWQCQDKIVLARVELLNFRKGPKVYFLVSSQSSRTS